MKIYHGIEELVGKTPLLRLSKIEKKHGTRASILAKLEYLNPAGSTKDRAAKYMIDDAERRGILTSGSVIIEPTSGNTGIGLSALAAARGYRAVIVMPDTMSKERQSLMRAYGAEVVLSDGSLGMAGAIALAEQIQASTPNSFIAGQFENPENVRAHRETTGPEIFEDTDGAVDIFVAGVGTGGTISGVGEYLKSVKPQVKIIAVEPKDSPYLTEGYAGAHKLQGIGAGFLPKILNTEIIDEIITVSTEQAYSAARDIARYEGALVGISSGAALYAAIEVAKREENRGKTVAVLLPDTGDRYLSTDLFD